ncbi:MAG: universal stress protein family domain protein [Erythrobacter sp. RIFCSPHIGHO2_12_FULL_63_10]|nr:MAG: universal stress protein family domain protein [Erythrobacter sp. RIFCSPHIGHO2_12_FULL_63_10]
MKSILLHISDDSGLEARLQASLDLARTFDGHVTCLQSISFDFFASGDFYGVAIAAAMATVKESAEELRAKIEARLANEDVAWEWVSRYGMAEHCLLEHSAINDVIVVGPYVPGGSNARPSQMVGDLLMRARTPVLVIPGSHKRFDCSGPVLVAWNGSTESCIALRAALPLLKKSSAVYLVTVTGDNDRERFDLPPVQGAEYLSRHGIQCELVEIDRGDATVADALFTEAQTRHCAYLVMGAYGHSRLAEMLLGGMTRRALTDPQLPMLLAH